MLCRLARGFRMRAAIAQEIEWDATGTPVSPVYGDTYYMPGHGLGESRHVFLAGNGLPGRFRPGFHIAELGTGSGLNLIAAWAAWQDAGISGDLRYTGFEAHPLAAADIARALSAFPELAPLARPFAAAWAQDPGRIALPGLDARILPGDARDSLPPWQGRADAWFLDGFAPARNPAMWEPALLAAVARHTAPGGTCASFTAAGHVRRALAAAGFAVERRPGYGRKRHMTAGILR
jgi:tRNA U34 5-methylaminomethyl-2-thiouridine-forming methyltransferase MnmC